MGQLEKYGLYVLCLVIFLILGVTIWGGGDLPPNPGRGKVPSNSELNTRNPTSSPAGKTGAVLTADAMDALLRPGPRNEPKKGEGKAADATGDKAKAPGGETPKPEPAKPAAGKPEVGKPAATEVARPTHKVQSGDSFESISKQHFGGSAALVGEIARLNTRLVPTKLKLGTEVLLPTAAEAQQFLDRSKPRAASQPGSSQPAGSQPALSQVAATGSGTYRVVRGDTLEGIAIRQLGSRARLADLQELNPGITPTLLKTGSVLKLPKK